MGLSSDDDDLLGRDTDTDPDNACINISPQLKKKKVQRPEMSETAAKAVAAIGQKYGRKKS